MGVTTELDVVNNCLATLGETALNSLDDDHPFVGDARRYFKSINAREQGKQWWFNTEFVNLAPDAVTGYVYIPGDTLDVDPVDQRTQLVLRGRRLYDPVNSTYALGVSVGCKLVRMVPFEDLPQSAQDVVDLGTQLAFQKQYDADRTRYQQTIAEYQAATTTLSQQHTRNIGANLLETSSTLRRIRQVRGFRSVNASIFVTQ